jgi:mannose-6-phosphate isomerase class I
MVSKPVYARTHSGDGRVLSSNLDFQLELLEKTDFVTTLRLILAGRYTHASAGCGLNILCVEGDCAMEQDGESLHVTQGDSLFIPPGSGNVSLCGIGIFLITREQ